METTQFERVKCDNGQQYIVAHARFIHAIDGRVLRGRRCDMNLPRVSDDQIVIHGASIEEHVPVAWVDGRWVDSPEYAKWSDG